MFVNQIAVFLENIEGRVSDFCNVLAKENVDIITMSIADTNEFGIIRAITRDNDKAIESLKKDGFVAKASSLLGVKVKDEVGTLAEVMKICKKEDINIEYMYSYVRKSGDAIILIKTSNIEKSAEILKQNNVELVTNSDL